MSQSAYWKQNTLHDGLVSLAVCSKAAENIAIEGCTGEKTAVMAERRRKRNGRDGRRDGKNDGERRGERKRD